VIARQTFRASARGMADAATVHKDTLVVHGLPATHLDDLEAGIVKLETSISDREKGRAERAGVTKGLAVEENNAQTVGSVLALDRVSRDQVFVLVAPSSAVSASAKDVRLAGATSPHYAIEMRAAGIQGLQRPLISIVSSRRSDLEQITAENHTAAEITTRRLDPHVICHTRILCRHQVRKHQRSDARCLRHPPDIFRRRVM